MHAVQRRSETASRDDDIRHARRVFDRPEARAELMQLIQQPKL